MNMEAVFLLSRSLITAVIIFLIFLFLKNLYECKYENKSYYILGYIVALLLMMAVNHLGNPYVNALYSFISINAICMILFESDVKKIWFHNLLFWFVLFACDVVTVYIWSVIGGNTLNDILSNIQLMLGSNLLNIIFIFAAYRIYILLVQKIILQSIRLQTAIFMIVMLFFEIWILDSYADQITDRSGGIKVIIMLAGFLLINLFLAYILNQISEAYKYRYELSLSEQMCKMYLDNYTEISHKYEASKRIIHDIKEHIMVADEMKSKGGDDYLSEVYKRMNELYGRFNCSNKILSVILNQKITQAQMMGIKVDIQVDDVPMDFMNDFDITSIFANLWGNAIEACSKNGGNNFIKMSISRLNGLLLIKMENSYNGIAKMNNDKYVSTKQAHDGIGLKSIQMSVEKYNGMFYLKNDDITFTSEITIPIQ